MTEIRLVVFDADDVIFSSSSDCYLGQVTLPAARVDLDIVEDAVGCKVRLDPEARSVLGELKKKGVHVSLNSINKPREANEILKLLELDRTFEHPKINFGDKGRNMLEILDDFEKEDGVRISADQVMFIDDVEQFCLDVKTALQGKGVVLQMGKDIFRLSELLGLL